MREKESERLNPDPDTRVLRDEELEAVSGGKKVEHQELVVVHKVDKASPVLLYSMIPKMPVPDLIGGWEPVFGKDHAPPIS